MSGQYIGYMRYSRMRHVHLQFVSREGALLEVLG